MRVLKNLFEMVYCVLENIFEVIVNAVYDVFDAILQALAVALMGLAILAIVFVVLLIASGIAAAVFF